MTEQEKQQDKASPVEAVVMLPCPFCGSNAQLNEWECSNSPALYAQVVCDDCDAHGPVCHADNRLGVFDAENGLHKEGAIKAWNTRT